MTRQQFERMRLAIEAETYAPTVTNPLSVGNERCEFQKRKLERLLAAARAREATTIQRKAQIYQREIERINKSRKRFEQLREQSRHSGIAVLKLRATEQKSPP